MRKLHVMSLAAALAIAGIGYVSGCGEKSEKKSEVKVVNPDGSTSKTETKEKTTTGNDGSTKTTIEHETKTTPPNK